MCQSLADGGKRCAAHTAAGRARRSLAARFERQVAVGDTTAAFETAAMLDGLDRARAHYGDIVTPMCMDLPASVHPVFDAVRGAGFRPLVVGGSVRDALSDGRAPKDVDVEVYGATIDQTVAVLRGAGYRVDEVGKAFGVLKVGLSDGTDLDVSVPRRDNHVGAGHRGFEVETDTAMTATEAAARRDFTINAMGYDPEYRVCVDPYNGRADLKAGVLRATSEAFDEDPLRVLRGFQFAARYGMDMDLDTRERCILLLARARELPVERFRGEWWKFYTKGTHAAHGLKVLGLTGWTAATPGLVAVNSEQTRAQAQAAADLATEQDLDASTRARLLAATIARGMDEGTARGFMHHTLEGGDQQRSAFGLSRAKPPRAVMHDADVRGWAHALGKSGTSVREWARLETVTGVPGTANRVLTVAHRLGCADGPQPDLVLGRDIIARFPDRKPGPWTGQVQKAARQAQIEGVFTDRAGAEHWLSAQVLSD